jgi:hypothetical protein
MIQLMRIKGREKTDLTTTGKSEVKLYYTDEAEVIEEFNYSAIELLANICIHAKVLSELRTKQLFVASEYV